jgi:hypothetical protein
MADTIGIAAYSDIIGTVAYGGWNIIHRAITLQQHHARNVTTMT